MLKKNIHVSFVIPHKGRDALLKKTLDSINSQDVNLKYVEAIIVTQDKRLCLDNDKYAFKVNVIFESDDKTIAHLRNIGAYNSKGKYIAFIDSDIYLSSNWISVMIKILNNYRVSMACGIQCFSDHPSIMELIRVTLNNLKADKTVDFIGAGNLFLRRKDFFNTDGFPQNLTTCEDYYFCDNIKKIGHIYCTSKADFIHLGEDKTWRELFKKEIWRAKGNVESIRGRKIAFKELPSLVLPIWIFLFAILALWGFISKYILFSLLCFLFLFLPVIGYSFRMYHISNNIRFFKIIQFYSVFLFARSIGTIKGIFFH